MREERDVRAFFDDCHTKGTEVANLPLLNKGGAGAEDGAVEVLGGGEGVLECVDAVTLSAKREREDTSQLVLTFRAHHKPPRTGPPILRFPPALAHLRALASRYALDPTAHHARSRVHLISPLLISSPQ